MRSLSEKSRNRNGWTSFVVSGPPRFSIIIPVFTLELATDVVLKCLVIKFCVLHLIPLNAILVNKRFIVGQQHNWL